MASIKAIALDFDGVLTDGGFWWGPDGEEWKRLSFADVMGVSMARKAGLAVTVISGEDSPGRSFRRQDEPAPSHQRIEG